MLQFQFKKHTIIYYSYFSEANLSEQCVKVMEKVLKRPSYIGMDEDVQFGFTPEKNQWMLYLSLEHYATRNKQ